MLFRNLALDNKIAGKHTAAYLDNTESSIVVGKPVNTFPHPILSRTNSIPHRKTLLDRTFLLTSGKLKRRQRNFQILVVGVCLRIH